MPATSMMPPMKMGIITVANRFMVVRSPTAWPCFASPLDLDMMEIIRGWLMPMVVPRRQAKTINRKNDPSNGVTEMIAIDSTTVVNNKTGALKILVSGRALSAPNPPKNELADDSNPIRVPVNPISFR